jgi:hypothetical protein
VHWLGEQLGGEARRRAFDGARRGTVCSRVWEAATFKACAGRGEAVCGGPVGATAQDGRGVAVVRRGVGGDVLRPASEDHVWFEDRWMVASLCDE